MLSEDFKNFEDEDDGGDDTGGRGAIIIALDEAVSNYDNDSFRRAWISYLRYIQTPPIPKEKLKAELNELTLIWDQELVEIATDETKKADPTGETQVFEVVLGFLASFFGIGLCM